VPGLTSWEPAFAQDLEWTLLAALRELADPDGESAYFRLTTRPVEQEPAAVPARVPRGAGGRRVPELAGEDLPGCPGAVEGEREQPFGHRRRAVPRRPSGPAGDRARRSPAHPGPPRPGSGRPPPPPRCQRFRAGPRR